MKGKSAEIPATSRGTALVVPNAGWVVNVGSKLVRAVCVLGALLGTTVVPTVAVAGDNDQLFQRRPERLLIESARRISDGRKLQRDADTNFRRAEGGAVVGGVVEQAAAEQGGAGSSEPRAATSTGSAASADRR
jgi:hypothetical protein